MLEFVQLEKLGSPVLNNDHFSDQQDSPRLQAYRGGALRGADGDAASILSMSLNEGDAQVSSAETGEAGGGGGGGPAWGDGWTPARPHWAGGPDQSAARTQNMWETTTSPSPFAPRTLAGEDGGHGGPPEIARRSPS